MRATRLVSLAGADFRTCFGQMSQLPEFLSHLPRTVFVGQDEVAPENWREMLVAATQWSSATWDDEDWNVLQQISIIPPSELVSCVLGDRFGDVLDSVQFLTSFAFEIAEFGSPCNEAWIAAEKRRWGFGRSIISHGWGCAKGKDLDQLRHAVKDYFKKAVIERLTDPTLSAEASYQRMRDMLDGLHEADRGNLAEEWYFRRERPNAERHVKYEVDRPADEYNEARREGRVADGVEGKTAIEVKDIEGRIDVDQFNAYVDTIKQSKSSSGEIERLVYVFTKPEGALANLEFLADRMIEIEGALRVEVYDRNGRKLPVVTNPAEAARVLHALRSQL